MRRDLKLLALGTSFGAALMAAVLSSRWIDFMSPLGAGALAALWLWLDRRHRNVRVLRTLDALGLEWDGAGHAAVIRGTWEFQRWGDRWEAVCVDGGTVTASFWMPREAARWLEGKRARQVAP